MRARTLGLLLLGAVALLCGFANLFLAHKSNAAAPGDYHTVLHQELASLHAAAGEAETGAKSAGTTSNVA